MQRREFLQGSLMLGVAGAVPGAALAASPLAINVPPRTGLVLSPLNASDLSALLYELLRDAIRMENIELIKFFLEQGADVNGTTGHGWTPLRQALGTKSLEVMKFLVSQGADVNEIDSMGRTLLHEIVEYKRPLDVVDVIKYLVSQGADVHAMDDDGETPLHRATKRGFFDAVKCLVSLGADVHAIDYHGDTMLHEGVRFGDSSVELIEYLLSQGVDAHAQDHFHATALDRAVGALGEPTNSERYERCRNIIDLLRKAVGVDESLPETEAAEESVPLSDEDTSMTELVLPLLNEADTSVLLYYLLRDAISMNNIELVKFALEQGADVNKASKSGETPLHVAVWESSLDVVKFLVSHGADIHAIGDQGRTPLHTAVWKDSIEMAEFLLSQGADVNAMGGDGLTPLLESAPFCSAEMVKFLLSQGADIHIQDSNGKTALDRATDRWRPPRIDEQLRNVIDLLQKAGGAEPQS